jgi:DNA-binding response OmpR family regulator
VRLNILLVDDDRDFSETIADWLRGEGHHVSIAPDGAAATSLAYRVQPDIVLLDLGLPDADGHDLARALRSRLPATTPIMAVTGQRNACLTEGMDLLLHKPIPAEQFGALVKYVHLLRDKHRCL